MFHCPERRDFLKSAAAAAVAGAGAGGFVPGVLNGGADKGGQAAHATDIPSGVKEYRRAGMLYRRLGRTDLFVSLLGFGSHTDPRYRRSSPLGSELTDEGQARRDRQIAKALDHGTNLVDVYNNAGQWAPMSRLVKGRRDSVLVSLCRQLPGALGQIVDDGVRLFGGYVDLYRIYLGDGAGPSAQDLEDWDVMRKAKAAGKVRAIGISTHSERMMTACLDEFEGLDYVMFPYNFIHAKADYAEFLPKAIERGVGLIAIKPLAAGSIVKLDPRAQVTSVPENERVTVYNTREKVLLPEVVRQLAQSLDQHPDETLAQAALRFVFSRPFMSAAVPGMFQEHEVDENFVALARHLQLARTDDKVLDSARRVALASNRRWLPARYRWLDDWRRA